MADPFFIGNEERLENPLGDYRILAVCLPEHASIESKQADPLYASINWEGFYDRDLVIVEIRRDENHLVTEHQKGDPVPRYKINAFAPFRLGTHNDAIQKIARCDDRLEYALIGKDRTRKKNWSLLPSDEVLFALIDAMPMRQYEIQQKKRQN